ncbi:hypothetical protein B0H19DRAFT_1248168 [Mycena capillaripes]|nr:hypothetical protein B0H19DRAFT_1248168 [Mycena capillaripes]
MLSSSPSSPSRPTFDPSSSRRSDAAPFYMHEDRSDSFRHSRKSSPDIEAGRLPSDSADDTIMSKKSNLRGVWFTRAPAHASAMQLPLTEKGADLDPRYRTSKFEQRLQTGSWCAMVVLLVLTIYFLMRET